MSSPQKFRTLTTCALWLSLTLLLTTLPLAGLAVNDPERDWSAYEVNFDHHARSGNCDSTAGDGGVASVSSDTGRGNFVAFVSLRLIYFAQFSCRWLVICTACGLWPRVARLFQKGGCKEERKKEEQQQQATRGTDSGSASAIRTIGSSETLPRTNSKPRLPKRASRTSMSSGRTTFYPVSPVSPNNNSSSTGSLAHNQMHNTQTLQLHPSSSMPAFTSSASSTLQAPNSPPPYSEAAASTTSPNNAQTLPRRCTSSPGQCG
jgi:hypothetical protein